ncbi:MAG: FAD-binding dehydrogenase [Dermatophilaceae bacterium]
MSYRDNLCFGLATCRQRVPDFDVMAGFDREGEDYWARQWARAYVDFAAGEKRDWLHERGVRFFPVVGWAERGDGRAMGHGSSVPRFHVTWGTGPGLLEPFVRRVRAGVADGLVPLAFRHQVDELTMTADAVAVAVAVAGVRGSILAPADLPRAVATSRTVVGEFVLRAQAVIVTSGGIGANHDLISESWPERLGAAPTAMLTAMGAAMLTGVPAYVDGRMLGISQTAGANVVNRDRRWHYVEGIQNWDPIWPGHGIRILPGPSSMWFDGAGRRLPAPFFPGFDTLDTLAHLRTTGHDHSCFVLTQRIIEKEFALSGSEQNPDLTGKSFRAVLSRALPGAPGPVEAFKAKGINFVKGINFAKGTDFVVADTLAELVEGMNRLAPEALLDPGDLERQIVARDRELGNTFNKDAQITAIHGARAYRGDRLIRTAALHRILDPKAGPLIAVKLHILTRKTLGGLQTDLASRVMRADGSSLPGLYTAGEVAGFGGGGMHGYRWLEGTFLGGALFSGRAAGRAAAGALA